MGREANQPGRFINQFQQPKLVVRKVYFETIIYENLTTNCKCMLCHCTSKPTGEMAKMFMAIRSGCQENQDFQDEATNPEVEGRISRSATNGTASSHRQQQQSQLYQQLAEHEEHYAKTMTNSAIRKPSDHPATNVQIFDDDGDKELTTTTTTESYTIYCL